MHVSHVNVGKAQPLLMQGRRILSAIGKQPAQGPVTVGPLGLAGDEQADPSVHGGLNKAVYAYPQEHLPFWQAQRREHGASLFDEVLPPGFMGENLSLHGLLETDVWVGDTLLFPGCTLHVSEPRQPCDKFNAVMGFNQASKAMAQTGYCGFYLTVTEPGSISAGERFELRPGPRSLGIAQAFAGKRWKHLR